MQTTSAHATVVRCIEGDEAAFDSLDQETIVQNAAALIAPLKSMASRLDDPPALNRGYKGVLAITTARDAPLTPYFRELFHFLLQNIERSTTSHPWSDARRVQTAHFCTAHAVTVVKTHPLAAFAEGRLLRDTYLSTSLFGTQLQDDACARKLFNTVASRLELAASIVFKEITDDQRLEWLGSLFNHVSSTADASVAFAFMCGVMREVPSAASDANCALELTTCMLLWLPGMSWCLSPSTPLQKSVAAAAVHLHPDFFCSSPPVEDGPADAPPFQKWWLSALRVATNLARSDELVAVMVASLCCEDTLSVERAASLWHSLIHFSHAEAAAGIRADIKAALEEVGDDTLHLRVASVFSLPVSNAATESIPLALSRVLGGGLSPEVAVVIAAALLSADRHEFISAMLVSLAHQRQQPLSEGGSTWAEAVASALCTPGVFAKHPALRYHALSAVQQLLQTSSHPDSHPHLDLTRAALEPAANALMSFLEVQLDAAKDAICPSLPAGCTGAAGAQFGAKRHRGGGEGGSEDEAVGGGSSVDIVVTRLLELLRGGHPISSAHQQRVADLLKLAKQAAD